MKKLAVLVVVLLAIFCVYWFLLKPKTKETKPGKLVPIALKTHSASFNSKVDQLMTAYIEAKNAFVDDDTTIAKRSIARFTTLLDSIPLEELKEDQMIFETVQANINDVRSNAQSLLKQNEIIEMRKDFSMVTEMLYPSFFKAINYEGPDLYLQNCPMAFGDDVGANWISNSAEIVNPYLGKKDPKYKAAMLNCGEVKDIIKAKK